jgi:O-antigen ligase
MTTGTIPLFENQFLAANFRFGQKILQACLIVLVVVTMLAPAIPGGGSLPFLKAEQALIPVFAVLYSWLLMAGFVPMFRWNAMFLVGAFYTFCVLLSMWYGGVLLGQEVVTRDFYEIPKLWLPVVYFMIGYEARLSETGLRRLFLAFGTAILPVCFYAWGQWFGAGITYTLNPYYSGGIHDKSLLLTHRVYSTMGNPNVLGQLLSWAITFFAMHLLTSRKHRLWYALLILASIVTLVMTGSRYGLLTTSLGLLIAAVVIFSAPSPFKKKRMKQFFLAFAFLPLVAVAAVGVLLTSPHTLERFQDLKNPSQVDSLQQRFGDLWLGALADFTQSPVVGFGPAKARFGSVITDSEFLDVLKEFGLVGFAVYLAYFLFPLSRLWKGLTLVRSYVPYLETNSEATLLALRFTFVMIPLALAMNIGESTFYNPFLQGFIWLWLGVGVRSAVTLSDTARLARSMGDVPATA